MTIQFLRMLLGSLWRDWFLLLIFCSSEALSMSVLWAFFPIGFCDPFLMVFGLACLWLCLVPRCTRDPILGMLFPRLCSLSCVLSGSLGFEASFPVRWVYLVWFDVLIRRVSTVLLLCSLLVLLPVVLYALHMLPHVLVGWPIGIVPVCSLFWYLAPVQCIVGQFPKFGLALRHLRRCSHRSDIYWATWDWCHRRSSWMLVWAHICSLLVDVLGLLCRVRRQIPLWSSPSIVVSCWVEFVVVVLRFLFLERNLLRSPKWCQVHPDHWRCVRRCTWTVVWEWVCWLRFPFSWVSDTERVWNLAILRIDVPVRSLL